MSDDTIPPGGNEPDKEQGVFVCGPVFRKELDICLVVHDHEDEWQFLCGRDFCNDERDARFVGLTHLIERDPTLSETLTIGRGTFVEREKRGAPWVLGIKDS